MGIRRLHPTGRGDSRGAPWDREIQESGACAGEAPQVTEPVAIRREDRRVCVIVYRVLKHSLGPLLSGVSRLVACRFLDCERHIVPERVTRALQDAVNALEMPGIVVLGHWLLGNGPLGSASRDHTLIVPMVDDCVPLVPRSCQACRDVLHQCPGICFLSRGWLTTDQQPLAQLCDWSAGYGRRADGRLLDRTYSHYERVVLVGLEASDLEDCRSRGRSVAELLRVDYLG